MESKGFSWGWSWKVSSASCAICQKLPVSDVESHVGICPTVVYKCLQEIIGPYLLLTWTFLYLVDSTVPNTRAYCKQTGTVSVSSFQGWWPLGTLSQPYRLTFCIFPILRHKTNSGIRKNWDPQRPSPQN